MKKDNEPQDNNKSELEKVNSNAGLPSEQHDNLISDDELLGIYGKIIDNITEDRQEVSSLIDEFADMVINRGDASTSSKEALVNLLKVKADAADKVIKIADLMTRIKLKEKNTMADWQKAKGNQDITIIDQSSNRRSILAEINKDMKKDKKDA